MAEDGARLYAELKDILVVDYGALDAIVPEVEAFAISVQLQVGVKGRNPPAGDFFELKIVSPNWLAEQELPLFGANMLVVDGFNLERIRAYLAKIVGGISGRTPLEVMAKVSRFASWEGQDFVEGRPKSGH
jgi:hypothetical protein